MRTTTMRTGVALAALTLALTGAQPTAAEPLLDERRAVLIGNVDLPGNDLDRILDTTLDRCVAACVANEECGAFTFNGRADACFLKTDAAPPARYDGATSGRIVTRAADMRERATQRAAELSFLSGRYLEDAADVARDVASTPIPPEPAAALMTRASVAETTAEPEVARNLATYAAAADDGAEAWLTLARASLLGDDAKRSSVQRRYARGAAVNAYLRAEDDAQRALALDALADGLAGEGRREGRLALKVAIQAQEAAPRREREERVAELSDQFGLRINDHEVTYQGAAARLCISFSEPLETEGVELSDYLRLGGEDLGVEPEGDQLCLTGLTPGRRYEVGVREGLPAAEDGLTLPKTAEIAFYVRDREPSVRFDGRGYVLPRSADASIPLVSINADEAQVAIHRIADRNIRQAIRDRLPGRMISAYDEEQIGEYLGETVWTGTAELRTEPGQEIKTALPIGEALTAIEPGIYAMTARVRGNDQRWKDAATQWFVVSDIGLTTLSGSDGLHVFARSLSDASAAEGTELTLVSAANEVLGTATVGDDGYASFAPGLIRGEGSRRPALLTAQRAGGEDFVYLDLTEGAFDLSDRGVAGRSPAGAVDVFVTTERGAYRPGETVHATILARDSAARAVLDLPLTVVVLKANGLEHSRHVVRDAGAGGRAFSLTLGDVVPRGSWTLRVHADPEERALASARFLVEDFVPERIDVALDLPEGPVALDADLDLEVQADWLYGAPDGGLPVEGSLVIEAAGPPEGWKGWTFGPAERFDRRRETLPAGLVTGEDGALTVALDPALVDEVARPLTLKAIVRVRDSSGRPVERVIERPLRPTEPLIGLKPTFEGASPIGQPAEVEVAVLNPDGERIAREVSWELLRVRTRYQWYERRGRWDYESYTSRTAVGSGTVTTDADGVVRVSAPVEWGRYELRATLADDEDATTVTELRFDAGWYAPVAGSGTPDILQVSLDAEAYEAGETATLKLDARHAGTALVMVMDHRLVDWRTVEVPEGGTTIELPVTEDWGSGAYVAASLLRPLADPGGRAPARALGIAYAATDPGDGILPITIDVPQVARPRAPLTVALEAEAGSELFATIAVVDVGVLNLTGFEAPDPADHYFEQQALGVGIRDLYGRLIEGGGVPGALRSGGDGGGASKPSPPGNEEVVARFSGVLEADAQGRAEASFDLPDFNGTVKVMAVAWSDRGVGSAAEDVTVRDPIVAQVTVPRFLAPGDESRLLIELAHAEGEAGEVAWRLDADPALLLGETAGSVTLEEGERRTVAVSVAALAQGDPEIRLTYDAPDGTSLVKDLLLPVRANDPVILRRNRLSLAPGGELTISADTFDNFVPGTGHATLAAGPLAKLDVPGLMRALDVYPYGCTEQTTSRALPLLSFAPVAEALGLTVASDLSERIDGAIERVLARQSSEGGFGLWRPSSGDFWLDAYVTDFLGLARQQGYEVPETAFEAAIANLRSRVSYAPDFEWGGEDVAYALFVLAREGEASIGDLRYYADAKGEALATPLAQAQIGAALAFYGEQQRADRMFRLAQGSVREDVERAVWREDYGTPRRDKAGLLALAAASGTEAIDEARLLDELAELPGRSSTQEKAWTLRAAAALSDDDAETGLMRDGLPVEGPLVELFDAETVGSRTVRFVNDRDVPVQAMLTTFGVPLEVPDAGGNGLALKRSWYALDGSPLDQDRLARDQRLVVVLDVTVENGLEGRLLIDDALPAGLEIDNPNLLRSGEIAQLEWLSVDPARYTEARTDRFVAAVDARGQRRFTLAYLARAVSPGTFRLPAASVEDMYRPEHRANTAGGTVEIVEP